MLAATKRVSQQVVPGLTIDAAMADRLELCLGGDHSGIADRCVRQLRLIGHIGERFLADRKLLDALATGAGGTTLSRSAAAPLARWLRKGAPGTVRLRVPPFVVGIARDPSEEGLRIVTARAPRRIEQTMRLRAERAKAIEAVPINDNSARSQLELDLIYVVAAATSLRNLVDVRRLRVLHEIVLAIYVAALKAGLVEGGHRIKAGEQADLMRTIHRELGRAKGPRPISVHALDLEVTFELVACPISGLPLRIARIKDHASGPPWNIHPCADDRGRDGPRKPAED